jgi:small nuclear ribonucleoprotein (snRNP)-like protein
MVLEDVTELYVLIGDLSRSNCGNGSLKLHSDYSGNHTKLSKILLNGNNICMVGVLLGASLLRSVC